MVPKTERFEMRLDPEILERVDSWRALQGSLPSRAEAIRTLVEDGLASSTPKYFYPGKSERLMIWMLSEILMNLKSYDGKEKIEQIQEAIYGGHFWALEWELPGIFHSHFDRPSALSLVVSILDMWSFIESAYKGFSSAETALIEKEVGPTGKNPKFLGFDGNNETEYLGIATHLVEKLNRFQYLKGRDMNSHMPVVSRYRTMTMLFEPIRSTLLGRDLSVNEVTKLLKRS